MANGWQDSTEETSNSETTTPTPKVTPLPLVQIFSLAAVLLTESICSSMLLPFVGLYVVFLQDLKDTSQAGKASGVLVGLFMLGQVVSCKMWGHLSDIYGRKIPLMVGLFAGAWCMFFFGLAPNIYLCCILRFLHGFFNGNVLIAKIMIADITDTTNEAKGFGMISITWGVGSLIGPSIGGFLYDPATNARLQWMKVSQNSFFGRHPAFLSSLIIYGYTMLALVICVFNLKETNPNAKHITSAPAIRWICSCFGCKAGGDTASTDVVVIDCTETSTSSHDTNKSDFVPPSLTKPKRLKLTFVQALQIYAIRNITIFYMTIAASDMIYSEIFPLWVIAEKSAGGLELFSDSVGLLMLSYSIPSVIANMGFHAVCKLLGSYITFWKISMTVGTVCTLLVPVGAAIDPGGFWYIMFWGIVRQMGFSWGYSLIHLLTAKASPPDCVGSVYGISQSFASMTRCIVPFVAAPLFAWSIAQERPFPFNYWLLFLIAVFFAGAAVVLSFFLSVELDVSDQAAVDAVVGAENEEWDHQQPSAYLSLVASFCTNPLHDNYINLPDLESINKAAHAQVAIAAKGGVAQQAGPANPKSEYVIRASSLALLDSLRSQRVEGRRASGCDEDDLP